MILKIFGPPGTGKTTRLLSIVEDELKTVDPRKIAFLTFTKKASEEAIERTVAKFSMSARKFPYFRTIHSLAYRLMHINPSQMMKRGHYTELGKKMGYTTTGQTATVEGLPPAYGDQLLYFDQLSRSRLEPLKTTFTKFYRPEVRFMDLEVMANGYEVYKSSRGLVDFTDLLLRFSAKGAPPPLEVLCVDEAQDLSPLQWQVIKKLSAGVDRLYLAGDDDQAIYNFGGAEVKMFLDHPGEVEILTQSHRVPTQIHEKATNLTSRISRRQDKEYTPTQVCGDLKLILSLSELPLDVGTWYLLSRNRSHLKDFEEFCIFRGLPYRSQGYRDYWTSDEAECLRLRAQLLDGVTITKSAALKMAKLIDATTYRSIDQLEKGTRVSQEHFKNGMMPQKGDVRTMRYLQMVLAEGFDLNTDPLIRISTIHGAKGGEADNVVLRTDMHRRTYEAYRETPDDEYRVWYVGMTRAKRNLYLYHSTDLRMDL